MTALNTEITDARVSTIFSECFTSEDSLFFTDLPNSFKTLTRYET